MILKKITPDDFLPPVPVLIFWLHVNGVELYAVLILDLAKSGVIRKTYDPGFSVISLATLCSVAFAKDPMATEKASQAGLFQGETDRASVGAGAGVAGLLPVVSARSAWSPDPEGYRCGWRYGRQWPPEPSPDRHPGLAPAGHRVDHPVGPG